MELPRLTTVAVLLLFGGCAGDAAQRFETEISGAALGTTYSVKVVTTGVLDEARAELLGSTVLGELETVNRLMSTYLADSEISRFNRHTGLGPLALSEPTVAVLSEALAVHAASGGAFDVTVGPLVDLWGFGPGPPPQALPTDTELDSARRHTGSGLLRLDTAAGTLAKSDPEVHVDLSAIAKGHAVDRVAAALRQAGFDDFMVEVGGEIAVAGRNRNADLWRLAVEKPAPGLARQLHRIVGVTDVAMATSGEYRNRLTIEGRTVSHTIDPRTGRPITHRLASVSVLAERCSTADAWATALNVLGPEDGHALADDLGLAALFLVYGEGEEVQERETAAFSRLVKSGAPSEPG